MIIRQVDWTILKNFANSRSLSIQWLEDTKKYYLFAVDGFLCVECVLDKDPTDTTELEDFEASYKAAGNKKLEPPKDSDGSYKQKNKVFADADGFRARFLGMSGTATKNTTSSIDLKITEERYINGVQLIIKDHVFGDKVKFQVVDVDNVIGYGAGVVLDEFGTNWNLDDSKKDQGKILVDYPARILANLYIRIVYISIGTENDVIVKANLFLHKKT